MNNSQRYKCLLCGRDKFTQKQPHICGVSYRKRGLKFEEVKTTNRIAL